MPRKRLYNTDEERIAARRQYCKKSYQAHKETNAELYRLRALRYYYTKRLEAKPDNDKYKQKLEQVIAQLLGLKSRSA